MSHHNAQTHATNKHSFVSSAPSKTTKELVALSLTKEKKKRAHFSKPAPTVVQDFLK